MKNYKVYLEPAIHILFWLFIFCSINVDWTSNWLDRSIRTKLVAPLSVVIFPLICYANAFWLIPKYLKHRKWLHYIFFAFIIFILPDIVRALVMCFAYPGLDFIKEFQNRDSFIFGFPSPVILGVYLSFGYRFTKDWFLNKPILAQSNPKKSITNLLSENESKIILDDLIKTIQNERPYLNPNITLRDLATLSNTTDKKLSFVINQKLNSKFYDYINKLRIEAFKEKIANQAHHNLSLVGIAKECGFKSKSSFYRAFSAEVGMSPTAYIQAKTP